MVDFAYNRLLGKEIIIPKPAITITRSWQERLFSLPWRPWKVTKLINNPALPNPVEVWQTSTRIIIRQEDYALLLKEINHD